MSTKVVYNHKVTTSSTHKTINYLWEPLDLWNIVNFCTVCHQLLLATFKSVVKGLISGGTPHKRRIIRRELCLQCNLGISVQSCLYSFLGMCPPKRIAQLRTLKDSIVREETSKSPHIGHCSIRNLGQTEMALTKERRQRYVG